MSIKLKHLRYVIAAAESGSFRKAAEVLGSGEPAVSRGIRDLEDSIGVSLFIRQPSGVIPTLAGKRFLNRARQALEHIQDGAEEAAAIGRVEKGHLKIGLFSTLASNFLTELFDTYDRRHANVQIEFVESSAERHVAAIRHFDIDAAFVIGRSKWPELDSIELWSEPFFIALPRSHPLASRSKVTWFDLADEILLTRIEGCGLDIRAFVERCLLRFDIHPVISAQRVGRLTLLGLVAMGKGIVPVLQSELIINVPGVTYRPLADDVVPFSVIYSPKNDNPAVRTLLSIARSMMRARRLKT
ncbi:DNA-binding transcriptional LysR family regulator [Angulomicrobium tetraedrale]|uniref:DNA-binding transcriptional LysR family regulator n=1 Tax=Ancylobacter tetraedralis TaxID=217068 RepID=A0A839ZFV6_9HYPH|nr:LysR substrate-binding domain-containing protein [Ancylobacter tetraedralis]MBB3773751.1 DNA-binding transcriptional LysR family regulator [Ancylobacter tetraedralis]